MTCVHESVLTSLGLNPIAVIQSGTASGQVSQNVYPARIVFPTTGWTVDFAATAGVNLSGQQIPVQPPQDVIALLGRNLLESWILVWNGPAASWSVSF